MTDYGTRFRAATRAIAARAAVNPFELLPVNAAAALLECLDAGRPFCFLPGVDNVERVAMRRVWELHSRSLWVNDAIARYRDIRERIGCCIDTTV